MTIYGICEHYDCSLRNNAGYCQATVCMNTKYNGWSNKEAVINNGRNVNPDEIKAAVEQYRAQHMTNADRIRAMSDEELAEWMASISSCMRCPVDLSTCQSMYEDKNGECDKILLEWLKMEANHG